MTETVLSAYPKYGEKEAVLFGMPDTYIEDERCYAKLVAALADCDVAVGVFYTRPEQRDKLGMCRLDENTAQVLEVIDKSRAHDLIWAWGALAWKPVFWQYLKPDMPHVGYALNPAIEAGLKVCAVTMEGGYWDCGTPEEYFALIRHLTEVKA